MWQEFLRELFCKIQHRIHTDENPSKCLLCDMNSNGIGNVKIHFEKHAGGDYRNTGTDWI